MQRNVSCQSIVPCKDFIPRSQFKQLPLNLFNCIFKPCDLRIYFIGGYGSSIRVHILPFDLICRSYGITL